MCTQNYKSLVVDDTRHGFLSFSNNIDHNRTETVSQSPPVVDYCSGYTDFKVSHETPAFFFPLETCRMTHILFFLFFLHQCGQSVAAKIVSMCIEELSMNTFAG